mmetsp:Transcript_43833/g.71211  ORF Transcript_43833/g.71211 Transcript_43833/m.71211 type:complete len:221 (+) Transcript_43833:812-1474(+)
MGRHLRPASHRLPQYAVVHMDVSPGVARAGRLAQQFRPGVHHIGREVPQSQSLLLCRCCRRSQSVPISNTHAEGHIQELSRPRLCSDGRPIHSQRRVFGVCGGYEYFCVEGGAVVSGSPLCGEVCARADAGAGKPLVQRMPAGHVQPFICRRKRQGCPRAPGFIGFTRGWASGLTVTSPRPLPVVTGQNLSVHYPPPSRHRPFTEVPGPPPLSAPTAVVD